MIMIFYCLFILPLVKSKENKNTYSMAFNRFIVENHDRSDIY